MSQDQGVKYAVQGVVVLLCVVLGGIAMSVVGWAMFAGADRGAILVGGIMISVLVIAGGLVLGGLSARNQSQQVRNAVMTTRIVFPAQQVENMEAPTTPSANQYHVRGIPDMEGERR